MTSSGKGYTLEQIAENYNVSVEDLKMHAMFHTPMVSAEDLEGKVKYTSALDNDEDELPTSSLARKMRLRETDMLQAVANEYMVTLKAMGRRINRLIAVNDNAGQDEDQTYRMAKLLTKPSVELYLGIGGEIRQTDKTISDIERAINGPQNDTTSGLRDLADAIRGSDDQ